MEKLRKNFTVRFFVWAAVLFFSANGAFYDGAQIVRAETTVYVTPTGSKYHAYKCGNGTYIPTTLSDALARGLSPCSKCFGSGYTPSPEPAPNPAPQPSKPLKLNKKSLILVKGQKAKLKANRTAGVSWQSSKKAIASVSKNGMVTARKKGTAVVTAKCQNSEKKCSVMVEDPKLNVKSASLYVGQTKKLKLIGCRHSVTWSSGNSSAVKVSKGKLTAKRPGTAKIIAKTHGKKFICKVTVKKPKIEKILLGSEYLQMGYLKTQTLKIQTIPANAINYYNISVKSSNPSVVSASLNNYGNGALLQTDFTSGTATVTVTIGGKTARCQVSVAPPAVRSLTLDPTTLTLHVDQPGTLTYTLTPYEAAEYYEAVWTSADPSVATVEGSYRGSNSAYIWAEGPGETDITLTIGGKTAVCHIIVTP